MTSGKAADIRGLIDFARQAGTKLYGEWIEGVLDWADRNDMTIEPRTMPNPVEDRGDIPYFIVRLSDTNGGYFVSLFNGDDPGKAIAKARKDRMNAFARRTAPPAEDRAAA